MAAASDDEEGIISAINVTPLVDITLVLLIIMMVTAKIIVSSSLPLDLPKAAKGESVQLVFGLELHSNGDMVVDGKRVPDDKAVLGLAKTALEKNPQLRAVIRADKTVQHGRIIRVLDLLKQAGVSKIAFGVTPISAESASEGEAPAPAPEPAPEGE
ncbi:MAG TPA: biopolymer transporter ExbD [Polyangiaceae bacterium]|nr:biopolymer transporter ExbD [Polyangiaceae bacterium]